MEFAVTVDQVEEITNLDFFFELSNEIEENLEAQVNVELW